MKKHYASAEKITRARELRVHSTEAEKRLWYKLRAQQLDGHKFRRQHPVGPYILDFACEESNLGIELDGGQHNEDGYREKDARRTAFLERSGWRVIRFWNNEVMGNLEGVLVVIQQALTRNQQG